MSTYAEIWEFWYEAQKKEQSYNKRIYAKDKPTLVGTRCFDAEEDAKALRKAMKGLGTNEDAVIQILTRRTLEQRLKIQDKYQQVHGRNLMEDLKGELNGVFEKTILSLLKPLPLFFAEQVKIATKGMGTNEGTLIEVICTRDDESLKSVMEAFESEYGKTIEEVACDETGGDFKKLLMSIMAFCRDDTASSPAEAADKLCEEGLDEDGIRIIATSYTFPFLKKMFEQYEAKTGETFLDLIERKCKGDSKRAYRAIYLSARNRTEYFAHALEDAMKGRGTDDWALIRIIVSRCEIDLETIKEKYAELFQKDLVEVVKKEVSGDYEKALVNLLGAYEE